MATSTSAVRPNNTLPDEDSLVLPATWRRSVLPWRGGPPGAAVKIRRDAPAVARDLLDQVRPQLLSTAGSSLNRDIADHTLAYLNDGTRTPESTAAVTYTATKLRGWDPDKRIVPLADGWIAEHGASFAAQTLIQFRELYQGSHPWHTDRLSYRMAGRVRAYLAAAPEGEYAAVCQAMAELRRGSPSQRVLISFLMPTRQDWVDQDIAETLTMGHDTSATRLAYAVGSLSQLKSIIALINPYLALDDLTLLATVISRLGPAVAPSLTPWLDHEYISADQRRRLYSAFALIPTDEAFAMLAQRLDRKYVEPAVLEATGRFPGRASRVLADVASGTTKSVPIANRLLRTLQPATASTAAVAGPDLLPPILVAPPWSGTRRPAKPVVIDGLTVPDAAALAWEPGERESWSAEPTISRWPGPTTSWDEQARQFSSGALSPAARARFLVSGPRELVVPLLRTWQPEMCWDFVGVIRCLVARYEMDAVPAAVRAARHEPTQVAAALLPVAATEVAGLMADWLLRLKSVRSVALTWLRRHPHVAAQALVPAAVGIPGRPRRAAEQALLTLARTGHRDAVVEAATTCGSQAAAVVEALLTTDPLDLLPAKMPVLPEWVRSVATTPVLLRDRRHALPPAAVEHLCTMLAMSQPDEVYVGVNIVREACDPASLAEFAWSLFQRWQAAGAPAKDSWTLHSLGLLGNNETVRRLSPVIRAWPREGGHARAVAGLDVLRTIGTDVALMHLHTISQKVTFAALKQRAAEKIKEVADDLGLTPDQLADRLVPDCGLAAQGSLTLDYGPRRFVVGFDEQLKPYVCDERGRRRAALPKPGTRDDPVLATAAYQHFAGLKKDVRAIASDQIPRLEQAMVLQRRWSGSEFQRLFVNHPLLWHIARRLVWAQFDATGTCVRGLRIAEDRSLADIRDDIRTLSDDDSLGIAHPLHLGEQTLAWAKVFSDYEIVQPFPQLGRQVYTLGEQESLTDSLAQFADITVATGRILGLERKGWTLGTPQDAGICWQVERRIPGNRRLVIGLDPGIAMSMMSEFPVQCISGVSVDEPFDGDGRGSHAAVEDASDQVTISEILRELHELTS